VLGKAKEYQVWETQIYATFDTVWYTKSKEFAGFVDSLFIQRRDDRDPAYFPGNRQLRREGIITPQPALQ
jgi:hypothetical protein